MSLTNYLLMWQPITSLRSNSFSFPALPTLLVLLSNEEHSESQIQGHISTDGLSVCLSWCRAPSGAHDHILVTVSQFLSCLWEGPL
jgi:hypothetical protein